MFEMVGKRLIVTTKDKTVDLGRGTYLWSDEILLDGGKKILGVNCRFEVTSPSEVPPFPIHLSEETRVFEGERNLRNTGRVLSKGEHIIIEEIRVCSWNHGGYVAGKVVYGGKPYWLLMSEVELPWETPQLRLPVG